MISSIVVLLPGQGSQRVGMGRDVYDAYPSARDVYHAVDEAVGTALSSLAFEGPPDELTRTLNAQPALLAHSAAVWEVVRPAIAPLVRAAAGHSLGEFSAYHVAGMFDVGEAARLVRRRGTLMFEQGVIRPGAMAAVLGVLTASIESICAQATRERGLVVPANFNSGEQVVISGDVAGVERAMALCKEAGAKRCLPLPVSGAFHSPLMQDAAEGLDAALGDTVFHPSHFPVVANVNGEEVTEPARARELLVQQLTAPVRWTTVMQQLVSRHPGALYVEIGTGGILAGLARRIVPDVQTATCGTVAEIEKLLEMVAAHD